MPRWLVRAYRSLGACGRGKTLAPTLVLDLAAGIALGADVLVRDLPTDRVGHLVHLRAEVLTAVDDLGHDLTVLADDNLELHRGLSCSANRVATHSIHRNHPS